MIRLTTSTGNYEIPVNGDLFTVCVSYPHDHPETAEFEYQRLFRENSELLRELRYIGMDTREVLSGKITQLLYFYARPGCFSYEPLSEEGPFIVDARLLPGK